MSGTKCDNVRRTQLAVVSFEDEGRGRGAKKCRQSQIKVRQYKEADFLHEPPEGSEALLAP